MAKARGITQDLVTAVNADQPLAVGSAFKLTILAAWQNQITRRKHTWDEVVRLKAAWKSLPSSIVKDWPGGSPLTLHTLAT
jgi:beta-lactamase class A